MTLNVFKSLICSDKSKSEMYSIYNNVKKNTSKSSQHLKVITSNCLEFLLVNLSIAALKYHCYYINKAAQ